MQTQHQRIQFLDFMRGFAVVVMVMGHSIDSVLTLEVRMSESFRLYDAVRGFTAPIFLFVSGYAFIVATERRWQEFLSFSRPLARRLLKILSLLCIGYALHVPFFSLNKLLHNTSPEEYAQLFEADVLHCVAASIFLLQLIMTIARTPRSFALTLIGLGATIVLATPFVWQVDFAALISPVVAPYLNGRSLTIFPLFPYTAFVFAGASVGHFFLIAHDRRREREFFRKLVVIGSIAILCGLVCDLVPWEILPPHDYWKSSPDLFLIRCGAIFIITDVFYSLKRLPSPVAKNLITLGQASLLVYAVHLLVVYGSAANDGLMQWIGQSLAYYQAALVGVGMLLIMIVLVHFWNYIRARYLLLLRCVQAAAASTLLFYFVTKPW
jgi:acyltransferase